MRKLLIGTSALVAAVSFTGAAQAADPVKLSNGAALVGYTFQDSENDGAVNATPAQITSNRNSGWGVAHGLSLTF